MAARFDRRGSGALVLTVITNQYTTIYVVYHIYHRVVGREAAGTNSYSYIHDTHIHVYVAPPPSPRPQSTNATLERRVHAANLGHAAHAHARIGPGAGFVPLASTSACSIARDCSLKLPGAQLM